VHPHILCEHKLLFWMRLIVINRLTALVPMERGLVSNIYIPCSPVVVTSSRVTMQSGKKPESILTT